MVRGGIFLKKYLFLTYDGQSTYSDVTHWSFDDIWEWLENDDDYRFNPRCIFR
nr:MAG TPA: Polycomb protein Scm, Polycomb protein PhoRC SAM domain Polycom.98A [Caudoviricetes sp.]